LLVLKEDTDMPEEIDLIRKIVTIVPIKHEIEYDKDVMSRGQLKSKKWLVDELSNLNLSLGTMFLCAGWYASIVPLMQEAKLDFEKIRSFNRAPIV
jgi:hypothetical protein